MSENWEVAPVCPRCGVVDPWMTQEVPAWTRVRGVDAYGTVIGSIETEVFGSVTCHECNQTFTEAEVVAAST